MPNFSQNLAEKIKAARAATEEKTSMMTIEQAGLRARLKPGFGGLNAYQAGEKFLQQNPDNWNFVSDGAVAEHLGRMKDPSYKDKGGLMAWFAKKGEKNRAEFFQQRAASCKAIAEVEKYAIQTKDLELQQRIAVAMAKKTCAETDAYIHHLGLLAGLDEKGFEIGMTGEQYAAQNAKELSAGTDMAVAEHHHELDTKTREQELELRLAEARETARLRILEEETRTLIADKSHEERERLKYELEAQHYQDRAQAIRDTALAPDAVRSMRVRFLEELIVAKHKLSSEPIDPTLKAALLDIRQKEIDKIQAELYGMGRAD